MITKHDETKRKEHEIVRNSVGYYDFTHEMIEVTGPQRGLFLDRVFSNTMEKLAVGKAKYTQMLNEEGIIIDDLIVFRISDEVYWITTLYIDQMKEIFEEVAKDYDVEYKDVTKDYLMYVVQGPKSRDVMNKIVKNPVDDLEWFSIEENTIDDFPVHVSRAGYTGELGYEIYAHPSHRNALERLISSAGEEFGILYIDTDVKLFSLPREKGYVLMSDVGGTNPLESGFAWAVDWDTDFIGKEALLKVKDEGATRDLVGFVLDSTDDEIEIKDGDAILANGEEVGKVVTIVYGFTVEKYIGYALIDKEKVSIGEKVTINDYSAELTKRIFYNVDNSNLTQ